MGSAICVTVIRQHVAYGSEDYFAHVAYDTVLCSFTTEDQTKSPWRMQNLNSRPSASRASAQLIEPLHGTQCLIMKIFRVNVFSLHVLNSLIVNAEIINIKLNN